MMPDMIPRDEKGRFVDPDCPDDNCGGVLEYEPLTDLDGRPYQHAWRCDGLAYRKDGGPLEACDRFVVGPYIWALHHG